jgi:hypothetical protein
MNFVYITRTWGYILGYFSWRICFLCFKHWHLIPLYWRVLLTVCCTIPLYKAVCAIAQAVSRRLLTVEARFRVRVSPCAICGGQRGSGTGFSLESFSFHCQYHSTASVFIHVIVSSTTNPHLVPRSRMSRSYTCSPQGPSWRVMGHL